MIRVGKSQRSTAIISVPFITDSSSSFMWAVAEAILAAWKGSHAPLAAVCSSQDAQPEYTSTVVNTFCQMLVVWHGL